MASLEIPIMDSYRGGRLEISLGAPLREETSITIKQVYSLIARQLSHLNDEITGLRIRLNNSLDRIANRGGHI